MTTLVSSTMNSRASFSSSNGGEFFPSSPNSTTSSSTITAITTNGKRRPPSPSSTLDCQCLQSSLKRVRLSRSPGELRLQSDLRFMERSGWKRVHDGIDGYVDDDDDGNDNHMEEENDMHSSFSVDSTPRWYYKGTATGPQQLESVAAELQLLDPLRLVLHLQLPSRTHCDEGSRIWIQIPRMYPHRPPVIFRIENLWMQRVLVLDTPPEGTSKRASTHSIPAHNEDTSKSQQRQHLDPVNTAWSCHGSLTVCYNQWSPVQHLGNLLEFLIQASMAPPSPTGPEAHHLQHDVPTHSSRSCRATSSSVVVDPSTDYDTLHQIHGNGTAFSAPLHYHHQQPQDGSFPGDYMEEHKMEDVTRSTSHQHHAHHHTFPVLAATPFAPNRFDMGYGKYRDPLERHAAHHSVSVAPNSRHYGTNGSSFDTDEMEMS